MESVKALFKKENDFLYRLGVIEGEKKAEKLAEEEGRKIGREQISLTVIKKLLLETDFSVAKIAFIATVTEDFVNEVKKTLQ